ncbi:hypothetical protein [Listeria booriae]|uniref:hypothetical protein n=1 Tax=Listeria booriae TaxID=1552123 RepID=UPI001625120B|nr:hypothetical protein [Listeria booriae]MBC1272656.1 hypothetical protein [Listeria booriae]
MPKFEVTFTRAITNKLTLEADSLAQAEEKFYAGVFDNDQVECEDDETIDTSDYPTTFKELEEEN